MAKSKAIDSVERLEPEGEENEVLSDEKGTERAPLRRGARLDELTMISDGLETQLRTRAVEKILSYHASLRAELDRLCAEVGSQAETIARLEARLALRKEAESETQTPRNGKSKTETVDYTKPENDRRVNDKLGFWERQSYSGPERRKKEPQPARKGFLVTRI